jgi:phosphoribosylanthranilate isomerase
MRTRVKICCIASLEEARLAVEAGADAIGFVGVSPPNPRSIPDALIAEIASLTPPPVATFVLTSERTAEGVGAQLRRTHPTTVQILHHIDPVEASRLAKLEPHVRRVQVIHVENAGALDLIPIYAPHAHAFLLDSGRPSASTPVLGGTGRAHDWAVSAEFIRASPLPVFLAGGLSAANAARAITQVRPFGLDVCTGVRTDGRLDPVKLADFMRTVREADQDQPTKARSST